MKYLLGLSLLVTLNVSFANECKSMCKIQASQCFEMVKGAERMTKNMIDQLSMDRGSEKDMKRQMKSQIKDLKFDCKIQKEMCFDMC